MHKRDNGALKLVAPALVDSGGGKSLPEDLLTDVGGNEERDTGSETVTLLQQLIEQNNNKGGKNKLEDEKQTDTDTEILGGPYMPVKT